MQRLSPFLRAPRNSSVVTRGGPITSSPPLHARVTRPQDTLYGADASSHQDAQKPCFTLGCSLKDDLTPPIQQPELYKFYASLSKDVSTLSLNIYGGAVCSILGADIYWDESTFMVLDVTIPFGFMTGGLIGLHSAYLFGFAFDRWKNIQKHFNAAAERKLFQIPVETNKTKASHGIEQVALRLQRPSGSP